ncbi:hypothetical protein HJG60_008996 [Phyllostomus discolor]|uniref:Uncharacterized protein n=1 Tax=Phyllostomus discolor TaxID=89673 RepID=A0A833YPJ9_9CHIR|nr:hypothetical protein HJG60_008996 [Phyllostomus discolor]
MWLKSKAVPAPSISPCMVLGSRSSQQHPAFPVHTGLAPGQARTCPVSSRVQVLGVHGEHHLQPPGSDIVWGEQGKVHVCSPLACSADGIHYCLISCSSPNLSPAHVLQSRSLTIFLGHDTLRKRSGCQL